MKSNEMRRNVMERGAGAHIVKSNGWSGDKSQYVRSKYTEKENVPSRILIKNKSERPVDALAVKTSLTH